MAEKSADVEEPKHVWVNLYQTCESCNYHTHICHFCGTDLDHEGYEASGERHWTEDCRPDLFPHEPGPTCTWPTTGDAEFDRQYNRPRCYWDHENNRLKDHM